MDQDEHATLAPHPVNEIDTKSIDQQYTPGLVKKVTHEVATDDMFVQGGV